MYLEMILNIYNGRHYKIKVMIKFKANDLDLKIAQCKHLLKHHQNHTYLQFLHKNKNNSLKCCSIRKQTLNT